MAYSILNNIRKVCKYHRSKEYYLANLNQEYYLPLASQDCWCLITQGVAGPDDGLVSAGDCNPMRECFKSQLSE
ncbi:MAG: hypothetical protein FVQ81_18195 [Candidatus Glassbacteria bacterium]|nr:hypothetical protein [Candidatus Glassbacteria bacterium]